MEYARINRSQLAYLSFLSISLLSVVIFRTIYSTPIEIDGDSVGKWFSAYSLAGKVGWEEMGESHHELRWAIILPQIIISTILPERYESYYVLPIVLYSIFTTLCMATVYEGEKQRKLGMAFVLGVLLCIDPISHVMASQLKTVAFGLFYFVLGVFALSHYIKVNDHRWLVLSAILFFFAYGSHITYLIFSIAPVLVLVVNLGRYRDALIFIGAFALLFAAEMLLTGIVLDGSPSGGRVTHLLAGVTHQTVTTARGSGSGLNYWDLISRWKLLPKFDLLIFFAYVMSSLLLFKNQLRRSVPVGIWMFFYASGAYAFVIAFPIVEVNPLKLAFALHNRYLAPVFPLAMVFLVWLFGYGFQTLRKLSNILPVVIGILIAIGFWSASNKYRCIEEIAVGTYPDKLERSYCKLFRYSQNQNIYPSPDRFLFGANRYYEQFRRDYLDGKVSLFGKTRVGVLGQLITIYKKDATLIKTPNHWYSVDGTDKDQCVMELGQTSIPEQNYRSCRGRMMGRDVFE